MQSIKNDKDKEGRVRVGPAVLHYIKSTYKIPDTQEYKNIIC